MATPAATAETQQATQETLATLALPLIHAAWGLFDPENLSQSVPRFREAVAAVLNRYGKASAALSLQHYRATRLDAGVPGRPQVPALDVVPEGFIDEALSEALTLAMPEVEAEIAAAMADLDAKAEQLVLNQGRRQMMTAVRLDREAKGWARTPNAGACSFCLMLSLRASTGNLYRSKRSANFRAHDNCRCTVEPVFGRFEPTAQVRDAEKVWADATKGRSGHDARVAFRQAVEGRPVTGAPKKSSRSRGRDFPAAQGKTPENQRAQLRILEAMPPAKTPGAAEWRAGRIAEIRKYLGE